MFETVGILIILCNIIVIGNAQIDPDVPCDRACQVSKIKICGTIGRLPYWIPLPTADLPIKKRRRPTTTTTTTSTERTTTSTTPETTTTTPEITTTTATTTTTMPTTTTTTPTTTTPVTTTTMPTTTTTTPTTTTTTPTTTTTMPTTTTTTPATTTTTPTTTTTTPKTATTTLTTISTTDIDPDNICPNSDPLQKRKVPSSSVTILRKNRISCSGVIISPSFVLAPCNHCLRNANVSKFSVDDLIVWVPHFYHSVGLITTEQYLVNKVMPHQKCFDDNNKYNPNYDLGLLQLKQVVITNNINFAVVPEFAMDWDPLLPVLIFSTTAHMTALKDIDEISWIMCATLLNNEMCKEEYGEELMGENNFCTTYLHDHGKSPCMEDYGAGIVVKSNNVNYLIGLIITKCRCGKPTAGSINVDVGLSSKWIKLKVQKYAPEEIGYLNGNQ